MNRPSRRAAGFTLIEAIIAIVITGILAGVVAVIIRWPIEAYFDTVRRSELSDAADTALRRIARDIRVALPNSLRQASDGSDQCVELLPVLGGGRYRVASRSDGTGTPLNFAAAASSFDVIGSSGLPASFKSADKQHVVIYNLGIAGADAYAGDNRAEIDTSAASTATATTIVLTAAKQFPFESPGRRFQVIADFSVVYSCANGQLLRSTRSFPGAAIQLASCPSGGSPLTGNVASCSFNYTPAVARRNGQLTMQVVLTRGGESTRLYQEVHVNDVP